MSRPIRVVIFGAGEMGRLCARYVIQKGGEVVGIFARKRNVGTRLSETSDFPSVDLVISDQPNEILENTKIDIAIICIDPLLESMTHIVRLCAHHGIDIVTMSENAFYPFAYAHLEKQTRALDKAARESGISILSSGVQDVFWHQLPLSLTAAAQRIDSIVGLNTGNMDDFGPSILKEMRIGEQPENSDSTGTEDSNGENIEMCFDMAMRAFTSRLGWHIKSASTGTEILLADKDIKSHGLGRYIRPGEIIGSKDFARYEIEGGPVIEVSFAAKIFSDNERAVNHWKIWGEPNLNVETLDFPGFEVTCASVINRIPDVMLAPPGFLSVCDIPPARFRASLTTEP